MDDWVWSGVGLFGSPSGRWLQWFVEVAVVQLLWQFSVPGQHVGTGLKYTYWNVHVQVGFDRSSKNGTKR